MQVPVTVYTEMTPNPTTMKFVANKYLLVSGESVEFKNSAASKGYSPFAEELFKFPFVNGVFIAANFVTITKTDNVSRNSLCPCGSGKKYKRCHGDPRNR